MDNLAEKLKNIISGEVQNDPVTLEEFSWDAGFFKVDPSVVVSPKNVADVSALVRFVGQNKKDNPNLSLTARAGGSGMSGGAVNESIIVNVAAHLNKFLGIEGNISRVQPGMYYRDFERETLKKNLIFPSFPASRELCAIGGIVANNAGGEKTLAYGKTQDYVKSVKMVCADGVEYEFGPLGEAELKKKLVQNDFEGKIYKQIYKLIASNKKLIDSAEPKVSKNSTGYSIWNVLNSAGDTFNLAKLIVGSQGTLGLITETQIELVKPKPHSRILVVFLRDTEKLADVVARIISHKPETLESYDDHTLKLAIRFFPRFVKLLKGNIISLGLKFLPEAKMMLMGGFPKMFITAEFSGEDEAQVIKAASEAEKDLESFGVKTRITKTEIEAQKYRTIRRESFNLLRQKVKGKQTAPFIDDIIVRPEKLPEFLPRLEYILSQYTNLTYTMAGHVGDGNFHIIPLMDLNNPASIQTIKELTPKVYDLVIEFEGSLSAEHNDGIIRTPFLRDMYGEEVYDLFVQIKNIFDPQNIFNPGKKVGGTFEYALEHIKAK